MLYNNNKYDNNRASLLRYGRAWAHARTAVRSQGIFSINFWIVFPLFRLWHRKAARLRASWFRIDFRGRWFSVFRMFSIKFRWSWRQRFVWNHTKLSRCVLVGPTRKQTTVGISWTLCNPCDKRKHKYELLSSAHHRIHIDATLHCTRWI